LNEARFAIDRSIRVYSAERSLS